MSVCPWCLTIAVPVFNELASVEELLWKVDDVKIPKEVIVVDDGSTDGTRELLQVLEKTMDFKLLFHTENRGKGAAVRTALRQATGEYFVVQDGDLEYNPDDLRQLISSLIDGSTEVVYGSRRLGRSVFRRRLLSPFYHGVSSLNWLVWLLYRQKLTDEATCYKMFKLEHLKRMELTCQRFEFCPEVTAKACRMGLAILEKPIQYSPRSVGQGKKIGFRDAIEAAKTLWKFRHWQPSREQSSESACDPIVQSMTKE